MKFDDFIGCLKARQKSLNDSLNLIREHKQDFSDWRFFGKEELEGKKAELDNALDMLKNLSIKHNSFNVY